MNSATDVTMSKTTKDSTQGAIAVCHEKRPCELKLADGTIRPMTRYESFQHDWTDKFGDCMFA